MALNKALPVKKVPDPWFKGWDERGTREGGEPHEECNLKYQKLVNITLYLFFSLHVS